MTTVEPDEVHHDIDPNASLDVTGDELVDEWRGVNVEDVEEVTGGLAGLLRSRSRSLLSDLMRPHHRSLFASSALIAIAVSARLAMPWLVHSDCGAVDGGQTDSGPARNHSRILYVEVRIRGKVVDHPGARLAGKNQRPFCRSCDYDQ